MDETLDCCVKYDATVAPNHAPVAFADEAVNNWQREEEARELMYQAREAERNARYFFQEALFAQLREKVDMTTALRGAKEAYEVYKAL